ncbi:uncharacterized protein BDR25DRAFT_108071 [Lindgomyces ingoldianus]|uniref:Uncharacterized protein n=1 Tax=Lindgomyces ingoldianus TaxID=673940 RepID=A0ACB6Q9A0_9PLEO|nr:uncharacterized protein BDR25DRAFT_108071 [Lindgomyces ingoldianus]KAF2463548.1 hypothetical protein BDR25DRAFT_108071 [Lindgomyces ingoldianus]
MSVRGRGGRGRGRPKTQLWHFDTAYRPGSDVWEANYRIKSAPPTVTRGPRRACPIEGAETSILRRTQTRDGIPQIIYTVEIRQLVQAHDGTYDVHSVSTEDVDLSRIDHYASKWEQQRFENAEFKAARNAAEVARRAGIEAQEKKYLAVNFRNSRAPSRMDGAASTATLSHAAGRGRGRRRGYGLGRGRESVHGHRSGRGDHVNLVDHTPDAFNEAAILDSQEDDDADAVSLKPPPGLHHEAPSNRASNESDGDVPPLSPSLMRSSFIANSALVASPTIPRIHPEVLDIDDNTSSMSSAAQQLMSERQVRKRLSSDENVDELQVADGAAWHHSKRRRTESVSLSPKPGRPKNSLAEQPHSSLEDESISESSSEDRRNDHIGDITPQGHGHDQEQNEKEHEGEDLEIFTVENIVSHTYQNDKKVYLVKWEGVDKAEDWLTEEELEGAADMLAEYKARIERPVFRKNKGVVK